MENSERLSVVSIIYLPVIAIFAIGRSEGRELRPSDHGLGYQSNSTEAAEAPEIMSFFGKVVAEASVPLPLPEAKNMSDATWWRDVSGSSRRDHERSALAVAAVACGATGVGFLVAAALLYLFRYQKAKVQRKGQIVIN